MGQRYKVAAFDLDGTLLDTSEGIMSSIQYTIEKFNFRKLPDEQLRTFIGPPIQNSFAKAYGLDEATAKEVTRVFRDHYKDVDLLKAVPYDGIFEVFEELNKAGVKPVIATYKRQDYATKILTHFGFDKYTDIMYGADPDNILKKKDIIENALKDAGLTDYSEAVMIGDSDNDAIGAEGIGCAFIGVTYGFGFATKDDVNQFKNVGVSDTTKGIAELILGS